MSSRPPAPEPVNQVALGGWVERVDPLRTTPAGIPVATFLLTHRSLQSEAGLARQAYLRIRVMAAGELSTQAAGLTAGDRVTVHGFLSRASYRREETHLTLHAQRIELETCNRETED